jgi:Tol biopolymer transport system component
MQRFTHMLLLGACALVLGLTVIGCQDSTNVSQPTSEAIVYQTNSQLGETYAIGVMQSDGTGKWIAIDGYNEQMEVMHGSLSPDGTGILYDARGEALKRFNLALGTSTTLYTSPTTALNPSYRRDGQKIVFCQQDENDYYSIYSMDASGANVRLIKANDGVQSNTIPVYNPTGTKIAYQYGWADNNTPQIAIMDANGANAEVLTSSGGNSHPSFLPDGRILYIHRDAETGKDVWVMDADGSNQHQLTDTVEIDETFPTSNADGSKITYSTGNDIFVADFDGSSLSNITNITADTETSCWHPVFGRIIDTGSID